MLIQETINEPDTMLKLLVSLDDQLQALQPQLAAQQLPRDRRGGTPRLCAAEVLTIMVYGAWLGLTDKAKLYYYFRRHHGAEFPALPSYSKFVEATNRVVREAGALLGQRLQANRAAQQGHPLVLQDSTPVPVCKVARAKQHRTFKEHARKSRNGSGYWYGFKLHVQCDQRGRLCAVRLTAANVDDRKLLDPLCEWIEHGIVVGDRGYISQAKAEELGRRGIKLFTPNRKNMKKLATPFQVACLQGRHRVEDAFEFLKCCFGMIRSTHRADYAFAIHLLVCLLAYSLFNLLFQ